MADRYGYQDEPHRHERGFTDRARDEMRSWFGDEEAQRRRQRDERGYRESGRRPGNYDYGWASTAERPGYESSPEYGWRTESPARRGPDETRGDYDPTGAVSRGWNEPNYGYRPSKGYGYGEWASPDWRARQTGDSRGYDEDDRGRTYEFEHGPSFAGRGPKGYRRSDERIHEDVCDRLADDARVDASGVEVAVKDGEVTLTGTVRSRGEKRRSEDVAEFVPGVRDVQNNLRVVRPFETPS